MHQVLYRKWRPQIFSDVIGQEHVTAILKNQIISGSFAHAYLFCGTRGSGKTTCARILSRALNCLAPESGEPCGKCVACADISDERSLDITEIDAASNNGVGDIRALRDESVLAPASLKFRVYIIDEVHMLSNSAFNALLKVLEEPPAHIVFILATTEVHKVPATILSRCQRFDFKRIPVETMRQRLGEICTSEGWTADGEALLAIARLADGAMRNALSLLEQAAGAGQRLDAAGVGRALGLAGGESLLAVAELIVKGETAPLFTLAGEMYESGIEAAAFLGELHLLMRDLLMIRALGENAPLSGSGYDHARLLALARTFPTDRLAYSMGIIEDCAARLSGGLSKRAIMELCLFRLASRPSGNDTEALALRIFELERKLESGAAPSMPAPAAPAPEAPKPEPDPQPQPVKKAAPPPKEPIPEETKRIIQKSDDLARDLIEALEGKIDLMPLIHLKRSFPALTGGILRIICPGEFDREQIDRREVREAIASAAGEILGVTPEIVFEIGTAEPRQEEEEKDAQEPDEGDSLALLASLENEYDDVVSVE